MTSTRPRTAQQDPAEPDPAPDPAPLLPVALRQGFSVGQGIAALVMIAGLVLLLAAGTALRPLGTVLLGAGIVTLVIVETVRVARRRRALRPR